MSFIAASPDQQRVRRIRRALVAVSAALDDQAQIVIPGEIDRGDHVGGRLCAATAYTLGADIHASTQPDVCVAPA